MAAAEAQGKLPAELKRVFGELLEPKVDWKDKVRALVLRAVGGNELFVAAAESRRLIVRGIGAPGKIGYTSGVIVIGGDTSGSINAATLDMFLAEIKGVLEACVPEKLYLVWCDARIHRVDELEEVGELDGVQLPGRAWWRGAFVRAGVRLDRRAGHRARCADLSDRWLWRVP